MAETRLSKVLIKQQQLDEQGNPVYVYTEVPFAADIDDFIVYTDDNGAAHSVKDLVFGDTPPSDFITNGNMWKQLKAQTDACQKTLTDNASFWDGLSKASYAETTNGAYLASGVEVSKVNFYGEDTITAEIDRKKLVSLGALEDFAKRVPTMGGSHNIGQNHVALNPDSQATGTNSFAVNGGMATQENSVAIGPGTVVWAEDQTVLGQYNELDSEALLVIGAGTSEGNRRNSLKIDKDGNVWLPKMRKGSNNLNDNWENYINQDSDVSQILPAGFISGTFTVGYRNADKTWLGGKPQTFDLEKGVQTSLHLYLGQISDSEVVRADIEYDGKYFVDIQGTKAIKVGGHEESITITLLYTEMCVLNFF